MSDIDSPEKEDDAQNVVRSEASFFAEWELVKNFINEMCGDNWEEMWTLKWEHITTCLLLFQEQPTLLGPYLEDIVVPLTIRLIDILQREENTTAYCQRMNSSQFHAICKVLQLFCRIRGYKHVIKFFPHEVSHIEICMFALRSQDKTDYANWETRYVMLLWLCVLCLIPFDICSMDSSLSSLGAVPEAPSERHTPPTATSSSRAQEQQSRLVLEIISVCREHLAESGPTREAASACLSALFTRPDMESTILADFMAWSCGRLEAWAAKGGAAEFELNRESFQLIGLLHTISQVFKKGHRNNVLPFAAMALGPCLALSEQSNQTLVRKLLIKVFQRIALTFLPPREAAWRYQRGSRSLLVNLSAATSAAQTGSAQSSVSASAFADQEEAEVDIPAELEEIVEKLLCALRDKDTVVRWSAAKGVGRITMRLPLGFGDDVVGAVVDVFSDEDSEASWHGGCLAVAELSRRGLLLPERLGAVVPIVVKAMHFDIMRGQHSVGAHVRDSACYVCWAFARAYAPEVLKPFVATFTEAMLLASLFDREINCRRAASAAFQENVGRQGNENFPHGIEVIAVADYFTLGNRSLSYLTIAPAVARMNEDFNRYIVQHLSVMKLSHWDVEIRSLTAKALGRLAELDPALAVANLQDIMSRCMSSQPTVRHGSLLAVAEVVMALSLKEGGAVPAFTDEVIDEVVQLVPKLDKARLYRGKGGEQVREASCSVIEAIGRSQLPMPVKAQVALVEFLNENLRQPHEHIQMAAARGLRHMLFSYFPVSAGGVGPSERLQSLTVLKYMEGLRSESNVAVTRGYALALGALPPKLLRMPSGRTKEVFAALRAVADVGWKIAGETDVETRRNALESIAELGEKLLLVNGLSPSASPDGMSVAEVVELLLSACEDYSVDKRGDTGSWCRVAGMKGLQRVLLIALRCAHSMYPKDDTVRYSAIIAPEDSTDGTQIVVGSHVLTVFGHAIVEAVSDDTDGAVSVSFPPHSMGAITCSTAGEKWMVAKRKGLELIGQSRPLQSDAEFMLPNAADRRSAMLSAQSGEGLAALSQRSSAFCLGDAPTTWDPKVEHFALIEQSQVYRIVGVIIKQLGEKLDAVREVAGGIIVNLLRSTDPDISIIPDRSVLQACLVQIEKKVAASTDTDKPLGNSTPCSGAAAYHNLKWTQHKFVYTFLTGVLDSEWYFAQVVSGMIISIGGLSEGIVKESLAALLHWCNLQKSARNLRALSLLASTLVDIFRNHSRDSRVVMPLLKCLSALLRNGIFDFLYPLAASQASSVGGDLHKLVVTELNRCGEIAKIRAGIDLYLLLLMFDDPVRPAALKSLLTLTGHKYPKVRKYAAEQLYVVMISDPLAVGPTREEVASALARDLTLDGTERGTVQKERRRSGISRTVEESQQAMEILTATLWEDNNTAAARAMRDRLAALLHVEITVSNGAGTGKARTKASTKEDELDSYDALVREAVNDLEKLSTCNYLHLIKRRNTRTMTITKRGI